MHSGLVHYGAPGALDVLQFAQFQLADLDLLADRADAALEKLSRVLKSAPNQTARSLAALSMGSIHLRRKGDPDAALELFYQVTGEASAAARRLVVGPLVARGRVVEAVTQLNEFLVRAPDAHTKARVIRHILVVIARTGDREVLAAYLARVPDWITEEEAQRAAEAGIRVGPAQGLPGGPAAAQRKEQAGRGGALKQGRLRRALAEMPDRGAALAQVRAMLEKVTAAGDEKSIRRVERLLAEIEAAEVWPPAPKEKAAGDAPRKGRREKHAPDTPRDEAPKLPEEDDVRKEEPRGPGPGPGKIEEVF